MTSQVLKAAVGLAAFSYLDAKYGVASDVRAGRATTAADLGLKLAEWRGRPSLYESFQATVKNNPKGDFLVYEGKTWTFEQGDADVRRIAHFLLSQGIKPGDRVAVFLHNSATYPLLWLACMSVNIAPAFINNGLTGKGLLHCIAVSEAPLVIFEPELEAPLQEVAKELLERSKVRRYLCFDDGLRHDNEKVTLPPQIENTVYYGPNEHAAQSVKEIDPALRKDVTLATSCALIYTSGTTGLPKAALCSHGRIGTATTVWTRLGGFTNKDRIYTAMPIYHSSAAFLCLGVAFRSGACVIIGRKFSASKFFEQVRAADATVVQYIGEIARYLLAVAPHPDDKNHRVRLAYGNGMRPDVWNKFRERFAIPHIFEFYASSEGNGALLNYNTGEFGSGAVGRFGSLARKIRPDFRIFRVDPITEDVVRGANGLCEECDYNEPGEFMCRINEARASSQFQGYAGNPDATKKKILRDVKVKGDAWFRTGDLMRMDSDGFYWFGDRMGDTFRWRSENVSTAEVASVLGEKIAEANVYGVLVPNHDGRAGCAAIPRNAAATLDLVGLATHARKSLPKYSVPLFLRIVPEMESTGTAKQLKVALRNQGIEHAQCGPDPLYWLPPSSKAYLPFEPKDLEALKAGKVKL